MAPSIAYAHRFSGPFSYHHAAVARSRHHGSGHSNPHPHPQAPSNSYALVNNAACTYPHPNGHVDDRRNAPARPTTTP